MALRALSVKNWRGFRTVLVIVLTFANCTIANAGANAGSNTPLTQYEQEMADTIARVSITSRQTERTLIPEALTSNTIETLLVTLKEKKTSVAAQSGNRTRLAEIFIYDYSTQQTEYRVIDLVRKTIVRAESLNQHHLPLNQNEQELARQILYSNTLAMQQIRGELANTESAPLSESDFEAISKLDIKVTVHEPHGSLAGPTGICAVQRCAELSLVTETLLSLTAEPVISLFSGQTISMQIY